MDAIIKLADKLEAKIRKLKLQKLIEEIESGQLYTKAPTMDILFENDKYPRQEYRSPRDRETDNYGYMTINDMTIGPQD